MKALRRGRYVYNDAFALIAACYISRTWIGDPLWILLVGPPGTGKSCAAMMYNNLEDVELISSITPASLVTAWGGHSDDRSLLARVGQGLIIAKDFGTVLSCGWEACQQILSLLREAYDGEVSKQFASIIRTYRPHFNFVAAVTDIADLNLQFMQQLGERFVRYRVTPTKLPYPPPMLDMEALGEVVSQFFAGTQWDEPGAKPPRWIESVATIATHLRTVVPHDKRSHEVLEVPRPERPGRLLKQLIKLYKALTLATGDADYAARLTRQTALSCIAPRIVAVMDLLLQYEDVPTTFIRDSVKTGPTVTRIILEDLRVMGLATRSKPVFPKEYSWNLTKSVCSSYRLLRHGEEA